MTRPPSNRTAGDGIRAVGRAMAIFDAFDEQHATLSLQTIGQRIGMPKTTTFRLVQSLEVAGFLVRVENQQYALSMKLVRLAGLVRSTLSLRETARPVMLDVNERTGETVTLNTLIGLNRACIEVVETPAPLMHIVRPGEHLSLTHGATGRILLAHLDAARQSGALASVPPRERPAILREVALFRGQGWAVTSGQRIPGVTAVAVPLFDLTDAVSSCLALTGPSVRMDPRLAEFTEIMREAGRAVSDRLGGRPPVTRQAPLRELAGA
jgi:IclR family KDG regulon transcriptional repressor